MTPRALLPLPAVALLLATRPALSAGPTKQECVAANEAAQDFQRTGKLREAREKLVLCVSQSCPGPVREDCAQRLDDVDKAMPTIVFEVKDASGNDVAATTVTMDGQPLADRLGGTAIRVDPGEHHFTFEDADGIAPRTEKTIVVREGDKDRHVRVVLGGQEQAPAAAPPHDVASAPVTADSGSSQRTIGLVLGGAGVVGLVVGGVFGLVSKSTYDQASPGCRDGSGPCSQQDAQHSQDAHSQATISTVGFIAGAALLGVGAFVFLTAPNGTTLAAAPTVGANGGGLRIEGTW